MPIPTPPKKDLLKVSPPRPVTKKAARPKGPSKATQKLSKEIRDLTEAQKVESNTVEVPEVVPEKNTRGDISVKASVKKPAYKPAEHLTQSPFRDNLRLQDLQRELNKESQPKKPVKRDPRRKPAKKTGDN